MSNSLIDCGLVRETNILENNQIHDIQKLVSCNRKSPHSVETRYWWNVDLNEPLRQLVSQAIRPFYQELQKCLTHQCVCESISMITLPGEPGQEMHVDNYASNDLIRWYTVGICLSPIDAELGTFNYVPGSHHLYRNLTNKQIEQKFLNQQPEIIDDASIVNLSMQAGGVFCYDTAILHQGTPNIHRSESRHVYFITFGPTHEQWCNIMKPDSPNLVNAMNSASNTLKHKQTSGIKGWKFSDFK